MDQVDSAPFNRGTLLNVGFLEARKLDNFTCFVFHDVDMVPETDIALYRCRESDQVDIVITLNGYEQSTQGVKCSESGN